MKKILVVCVLGLLCGISLIFITRGKQNPTGSTQTSAKPAFVVGLSMDNLREERWNRDLELFTKRIKELGGDVIYEVANSDADKQVSQAENLISQGVKVLVVVPFDAEKAGLIVDKAHTAGIKVIAYDRLIKKSAPDLYVSFDNDKVGRFEAQTVVDAAPKGNFAYIGGAPTDNNAFLVKKGSMEVMDAKIKSGDIKLVVDAFSPGWSPDEAYKTMKTYLATGKKVDGVVAANDGTALGSINALAEYKLAGKVPVSGQDAELSACQRIVAGTQTATVYKPIQSLAYKAAELAAELAQGKTVQTTGVVNNETADVPSYLIDPVLVTKANMMDTVIKDGFHTQAEVYGQNAAK
jgi:D-xylose transport system substrate-binding protein